MTSLLLLVAIAAPAEAKRPNIVWIVAEDISPNLGCYGDPVAHTPHLDRLASQGARFTRCFTHAPVCAPSRSGLITGVHPTTLGSHHMRSMLTRSPAVFTQYLRRAGYFVAWPGKTDFNFKPPPDAFDSTAPWVDRPPRQPFFAYVNLNVTHESQVRAPRAQYEKNTARLRPSERHDPAKVPLPPYYPDTPEVRRDVATYHDNVTAMDYQVGDILAKLDKHGLADNTVVFFFGDHGWGLPRGKRWVYDSGIRAPLLVRWPGKIAPGTVREDLVAFLDFAPTVLTIAGADVPKAMQGQVFLGDGAKERKYVFAARDRMDETYDRIRCVRDRRYKYIRNYHPELPYAQHIEYMDEMPTMKVWRRLHAEGKLTGAAALFFRPTKPKEELYDLEKDPHEIDNIIDRPEHRAKLAELRAALDQWLLDTNDLGAVPETELIRRGLVEDRLKEYEERRKRHPKPAVPNRPS